MHYYSFHIGDYMSHTRHLSLMEDLAFRRLLDFYYLHEQPIKQRDIARQIGMREYEQDVLTVLNEFFLSTEEGFVSPRADKEITEFKNHQAKSAWGAFVRDNKKIAEKADKEVFISKFFAGEHREYIDTLIADHLDMMGTSTPHDATNTQEPITINHKPKERKKAALVVRPDFIPEQQWDDWLVIRKKKDAPLTETAWTLFCNEVKKAGWSIEAAINECCLRNWASFKADWVADKNLSQTGQMNQRVASGLTRGLIGGGSNVKLLGS